MMRESMQGKPPHLAPGRRGLAALAAVLACAGGGLAAGPAAHAATARPATLTSSTLMGVSAVSPKDAWAVGYDVDSTAGALPLALHWNGTSWTKLTMPSIGYAPELFAVSALSATNVWAVGHYFQTGVTGSKSLIVHWNGKSWTQVPSPDPGGVDGTYLNAVKVISPTDAWAVGGYGIGTNSAAQTFVLHWNGKSWTQVPSPNPSTTGNNLVGVSAVSSSGAWAVGTYYDSSNTSQTLVLKWNGTSWKQVPSPDPGGTNGSWLNGVSAFSPTGAWVVGGSYNSSRQAQTLALKWNGKAWTKVTTPNPVASDNLWSVSAVSAANAWAVGWYWNSSNAQQTLIAHWNGTSWTQVASPGGIVRSVSADSSADAWAVGSVTASGQQSSFTLHGNGATWTQVPSPN